MNSLIKNTDEEVNLIDLKNNEDVDCELVQSHETKEDGIFDFQDLELIEKPSMSSEALPQTLEDCVGYLKELPLLYPNSNQISVVDMINILSIPNSEDSLKSAMDLPSYEEEEEWVNNYPGEYKARQEKVYNNEDSEPFISLMNKAESGIHHKAAPLNFGHVVRPGCISLYSKYGLVYAAPEGKWWLPNPNTRWMKEFKNVSLDQDTIITLDNQVMIVRIIEGCVGLITIQGIHHLLDVGTHVFNSGVVQLHKIVAYSKQTYFQHGPYHYMNIPSGKYAKVWVEVIDPATGDKSLAPRLVKAGEHIIKSTFFKYVGLVDVSDEYIAHDCVHILNVVKGRVAKVYQDNIPRLLGEGRHIIESSNFTYEGTELIEPDNLCIAHGTITILNIPRGKIALAWNMNEPYFLDEPGLFEFNSNSFHFVNFADAEKRLIELGSKKIIQVYTGEVGITYNDGQLMVLENGRHVIESSTHVFERFLSTKQKSIRLVTYHANHKIAKKLRKKTSNGEFENYNQWTDTIDDDADFLICETKDLVKVGVRADVFYSISDPTKCIQTLNTDELEDLVRETAVATLTNIIRSTALNQIAQSRNVTASDPDIKIAAAAVVDPATDVEDSQIDEAPAAVSYFFDRAHDEFMTKLHADFVSNYGVDIANIRMESFKIMDTELSNEISQNCLTTAHVENELANLEGQNAIATQKERTQADCRNIKATAEAKAFKVSADAENKRKIDSARAEAESLKFTAMAKAQAEADAILLKAKAEAEAIRLKAVAEAERAKLLSETKLGQQQSMLETYANMVATSNEGVQKVIYMDPSVNRDSPFALGSLDGLNRDLHALSKVGVATSEN